MDIFYVIKLLADWFTYGLFSLPQDTLLSNSVNFFIYDILKISILLIFVVYLMSIVRYYLPLDKFKKFIISRKFYGADYLLSSGFGAITPFCSCSSIPLFIGFMQAGIPLGVTFAFLITSPLINEIAIALFIGLFGWKITVFYILAGMVIGMVGGYILQKLKMDKYIISLEEKKKKCCCCKNEKSNKKQVISNISKEAFNIVGKVLPYIIIGVAVGAIIHGYVPANFFENYLQKAGVLGVPFAVFLAVPLYSNASGVIPIIQVLVAKGVPLGTALAFMMAVVGLSLPEAIILKKVLRWQLLVAFFGIVIVGIILIGYLFNILL